MKWTITIFLTLGLLIVQGLPAHAQPPYPRAGWTAQLSTIAHDVSGTVTIIDANTLRVDDFIYDGGGPAVYFYLGVDDTNPSFLSGLELPPLLSGTVYDGTGGPLMLDLPLGHDMDPYNAISVWCVIASFNFGSGTFTPEPGMMSLVAFGGLLFTRREWVRGRTS